MIVIVHGKTGSGMTLASMILCNKFKLKNNEVVYDKKINLFGNEGA